MTLKPGGLQGGRLVALSDADLHVYEEGPAGGAPIVLLHGFLTSAFTWRRVYPALAQHHRVFLVDLPGSGRSPDPRVGHWSADRCIEILADLFNVLELDAPTLVGSQMGGSLAAWFAGKYRHRVGRLVIMSAGVLGEAQTNLTLYRLLANPWIGPWFARHFPQRNFEQRWRSAHGPGHTDEIGATAYYFAQLQTRGHVMAKLGLGVRLSYGESFDALANLIEGLKVPTLLLFGGADPLVPAATGRRFEQLLLDARLVVLNGCGDFPQEERPEEVTAEILTFLAGSV